MPNCIKVTWKPVGYTIFPKEAVNPVVKLVEPKVYPESLFAKI